MLIRDLVVKARRILGDIEAQRWTNERMVDIVNAGIRDINKFAGVYRNEVFIPLQNYRKRYPLPMDVLVVTGLYYLEEEVPFRNQLSSQPGPYATKDQLNVGVLELRNFPWVEVGSKRFLQGIAGDFFPSFVGVDLWANGVWNNAGLWYNTQPWNKTITTADVPSVWGVVAEPVNNFAGVTAGIEIDSAVLGTLSNTKWGLLSNVLPRNQNIVINTTKSDVFGVFTNIATKGVPSGTVGSIGTVDKAPIRIAGRYGTVVSALKKEEFVHLRYKALPKTLNTLDEAFPLSVAWEEPLVNWIVGIALQDDNDAANNARAQNFLSKYARELDDGKHRSSTDYSAPSRKYEVPYRGGILNG